MANISCPFPSFRLLIFGTEVIGLHVATTQIVKFCWNPVQMQQQKKFSSHAFDQLRTPFHPILAAFYPHLRRPAYWVPVTVCRCGTSTTIGPTLLPLFAN